MISKTDPAAPATLASFDERIENLRRETEELERQREAADLHPNTLRQREFVQAIMRERRPLLDELDRLDAELRVLDQTSATATDPEVAIAAHRRRDEARLERIAVNAKAREVYVRYIDAEKLLGELESWPRRQREAAAFAARERELGIRK
jgi:hypothetical protein